MKLLLKKLGWLLPHLIFSMSLITYIPKIHANETRLFLHTKRKVNFVFVIQADTILKDSEIRIRKYWEYEKYGVAGPSDLIAVIKLQTSKTKTILLMKEGVYTIIPPPEFNISPEKITLDAEKNLLIKEGKLFCRKPINLRLKWIHSITFSGYILTPPENHWLLKEISQLEFASINERRRATLRKTFEELKYTVDLESDQNYQIYFLVEDDSGYPWLVGAVVEPETLKCHDYWRVKRATLHIKLSLGEDQIIFKNILIAVPLEIEELYFIKKPDAPLSMKNYQRYVIKAGTIPTWRLRVGEYLVEAISADGIYRRKISLLTLKNCPGRISRSNFYLNLPTDYAVDHSLVETIRKETEKKIFEDSCELYLSEQKIKTQTLPVVIEGNLHILKFKIKQSEKHWSFEWIVNEVKNKIFDFTYNEMEAKAREIRGAKEFATDTTVFYLPFKLEASYSSFLSIDRYQWGGGKWNKEIPGHLTFRLYQAGTAVDLQKYFEE